MSIGFVHLLNDRLTDLNNRLKNVDQRKKRLYLTCFISIIILFIVFVILFTCFRIFQTDDEKGFQGYDQFNRECLESHNYYRSLHGVPALQLDNELIEFAKVRADHLVSTDIFEHPKNLENYGENLHYIFPVKSYSCDKVVKPWYDEIQDYNYKNPWPSRKKIGHFTQVVWKSTKKVGCAQAYSERSRKCYTVCNYYPSGNYINKYHENVLHPISDAK